MRFATAQRVGTLLLLFAGVAHAESPEGSRFVRTSLEAAPVLEYRSPPRVITASLDQRETEVLGAAGAPRQLRRSLDEAGTPTELLPSGPVSSDAAASSSASTVLPSDGATGEGPSWQVSSNGAASAPIPDGDQPGFGALECDCARTRRQIRLTLDSVPAVPAPESTRIIRVQL
jgi:hypothetical protein